MRRFPVLLALLLAAACGGGTTAANPPPPPPPPAPAPVATVTLAPDNATLVATQTSQLVATTKDAAGNVLTGRTVTWASATPAVATVDATGLVTGVTPGMVQVSATSEGHTGTAAITVQAGALIGAAGGTATSSNGNASVTLPAQALTTQLAISVTPIANPQPDPNLIPGTAWDFGPTGTQFAQPVTLKLKYDPATLSPLAVPALFRVHKLIGTTWTVLPGSTVDVATQTVTGQTSSFSTYAVVQVPVPVATVDVGPPTASILPGATTPLTVTLKDAASNVLTGRVVTWSSGTPAIATVSSTGVVTGVTAGGPVTITATSEGQSGSAQITVLAPVATVTVNPPAGPVVLGGATPLTVTLRDVANNVLSGRAVTWSSGNPSIATVDAAGVVTGVALGGPVTITAQSEGQSGGTPVTVIASVVVLTPSLVAEGEGHVCYLNGGAPWCWGLNGNAEQGNGTSDTGGLVAHPSAPVQGAPAMTTIVAGRYFTCGLSGGAAWCWGSNIYGQLGVAGAPFVPVPVRGGHSFISLSAGLGHACGVDTGGQAWCWGYNLRGELGDGTLTSKSVPVAVLGGHTFSMIAASHGGAHTCALTPQGAEWCWGGGVATPPQAVPGGRVFTTISTGGDDSCGLDVSGQAWCFPGAGWSNGTTALAGAPPFASIVNGSPTDCAIDRQGRGWCWGFNGNGAVGDGTTIDRPNPTLVTGGHVFSSMSTSLISCGAGSGAVLCWGNLGSGRFSSLVPVALP